MTRTRPARARARIAAAIVGSMFIGLAVFGAALPANAAPVNAPVISSPGPGPAVDDQPLVAGTLGQEVAPVYVEVAVQNSLGFYLWCVDDGGGAGIDVTVEPNPGFSCVGPPLPPGENNFTARSSFWNGIPDGVIGPISDEHVYTRWDPSGHVELLAGPPASDTYPQPVFSGTGPALGHVVLHESNVYGDTICSTQVEPDGTWECVTGMLDPGSYSVTIDPVLTTFYDGSGPVIDDTPGPYTFDIEVPVPPTVQQVFDPWYVGHVPYPIQGNKAEDVTYVQVYYSATPTGPWFGLCDTNGFNIEGATIWSCGEPFGELGPGVNYISATGFYPGVWSDFGPPAVIERVAVPTIASPADDFVTNDPTPVVTGTALHGTDITVYNLTEAFGICDTPIVAGEYSCETMPLLDGTYDYFVYAFPGDGVTSEIRTITIDTAPPGAPTITPVSTTNVTPTLTGTGELGATLTLTIDGAPASCQNPPVIVDEGGQWTCEITAPLSVGTHLVAASQTDQAGNTGPTNGPLAILDITIPDVPPPLPSPAPTATPLALMILAWTLGGVGDEYAPGDEVVLTGSGLPAGAVADAEIHSTPQALGSAVVDAAGEFEIAAVIPEDIEPGQHTVVVTVTAPGAEPSVIEHPVMVVAPEEQKAVGDKVEPIGDKAETAGSGGGTGEDVDRNAPNAPSSMTTALDTILDIIGNPVVIASAAAIGVGLLLFVAIPAELLNATLSEQYSRFTRRIPALKRSPGWLAALKAMLSGTPVVGAILITLLVSIIFGFADPHFGFDLTSLRVVLACALGLLVVGFISNAIAGIAVAKRWQLSTRMELKPLGVVLAVIGVVISRLLDFSPGLLIGLLLGAVLVGNTTLRDEVRLTMTRSGVIFGFAIVAWLVYSFTSGALADQSFGANLFLESLVAITTEGLTALAVGLLPFKFLDGESVWKFNKALWAVSWLFVAAMFVLIVVPNNFAEVRGSLWVWGIVVAAFAALAVGIYVYFRFFAPPIEDEDDESAPASEDVVAGGRR